MTKPEARWVEKLKAAGIKQWAQVGSVAGALEAVDYGAEVIIAQGKQGGGHVRGFQDGNPLHRSELVPLVKAAVPKDVIVLGSGEPEGSAPRAVEGMAANARPARSGRSRWRMRAS